MTYPAHSHHSHADPKRHMRPLDLAIYFITFGLAVTTIAATSHALVVRNHEVGFATAVAASRGVKLIVATNALTQPGYALTAAAGGVVVNTLTLLFFSFKFPAFARKLSWILPIVATFNFVFMLATCIVVFVEAKHGQITTYGTLNGIVLPDSLLKASAASVGLTTDFWGKGYVKFLAAISVPAALFSGITAFLSWGFYKRERESLRAEQGSLGSYRTQDEPSGQTYGQGHVNDLDNGHGHRLTSIISPTDEKGAVQHREHV